MVLATAPAGEAARELARALVGERLAACVNVIPGLTSVFHWEGAVAEDAEALLVIKTSTDLLADLERRLVELHPYDVPEFVALAPERVEERYLAWLLNAVTPPPKNDA